MQRVIQSTLTTVIHPHRHPATTPQRHIWPPYTILGVGLAIRVVLILLLNSLRIIILIVLLITMLFIRVRLFVAKTRYYRIYNAAVRNACQDSVRNACLALGSPIFGSLSQCTLHTTEDRSQKHRARV
jgi:Flp pilus assembly protein TadB